MTFSRIKIKNLSSFVDFETVQPFKKTNLFFGSNGSGKSTLVDLFYALQKAKQDTTYLQRYLEEHASKEMPGSVVSILLESEKVSVSASYDTARRQLTTSNLAEMTFRVFNEQYTQRNIGDVINLSLPESPIVVGEKNKELDAARKMAESLDEQLQGSLEKVAAHVAVAISGYKTATDSAANVDSIISVANLLKNACEYEEDESLVVQRRNLGYSKQETTVSKLPETGFTFPSRIEDLEAMCQEIVTLPETNEQLSVVLKKYTGFFVEGTRIYDEEHMEVCPYCRRPWPDGDHLVDEFKAFLNSTYSTKRGRIKSVLDQIEQYRRSFASQKKSVDEAHNLVKADAQRFGVDASAWATIEYNEAAHSRVVQVLQKKYDNMATAVTISPDLRSLSGNHLAVVQANNQIITSIKSAADSISTKRRSLNSSLAYHFLKQAWNKARSIRETIVALQESAAKQKLEIKRLEELIPPQTMSQKIVNDLLDYMGVSEYYLDHNSSICLRLDKGYDISREGKRISTAQRKIISLCYFFAEVFAEASHIKDLREIVLVFDDPVDSADYVYFHSISAIIEKCENIVSKITGAKNVKFGQFFVFTHNSVLFDRLNSGGWAEVRQQIDKVGNVSVIADIAKNTNNYLEYVKEVVRFLKSEKPDKRRMLFIGNVIRRILEIVASFDNMGSNNFQGILDGMGKQRLAILANHLSHESFTKTLNPFSEPAELRLACIDLLQVIKERHPFQYETINAKYEVDVYLP